MFSILKTTGAVTSVPEVTDLRRLSHLLHALEYVLMARSRSSSSDSSQKPTNRKTAHACGMNTSCSPRPIKGFPAQCTWIRHAPYTVRTIEKKGSSNRPMDLISRIPTLYGDQVSFTLSLSFSSLPVRFIHLVGNPARSDVQNGATTTKTSMCHRGFLVASA